MMTRTDIIKSLLKGAATGIVVWVLLAFAIAAFG